VAGLIVGGVTIPIAAPGIKRDRHDGVDRGRAFDQTYRASVTGTPKRDWSFQTPLLPRASGDTLETTLALVAAQTCSGDVLGASVSCCCEIIGWTPVTTLLGQYVQIDFILHEV
jgi:hypothetical protein